MGWFDAPEFWFSRLVLERGLAALYVIAFINAANQFRPLIGEHGLLPVPRYLAAVPFRRKPSIFHLHYSDRFFAAVCWTGVVLAACTVVGLTERAPLWGTMLVWFVLWALYLSIVNVGQVWYGFGWESLLLEAGFLAIFLGNAQTAPPIVVLFLFRWLLFRVEFGAGLIKLRGDRCWRDLTCMEYHHETQPMPGPLSWYFHQLPRPLHKAEVVGNYVAQLGAPVALFAPQPAATIAAGVMVVTQLWLVASGNFAWLNWITILLAFPAVDDTLAGRVLPLPAAAPAVSTPLWYVAIILVVAAVMVVIGYWPARNMISRGQVMNAGFNPLHLGNTYGAFGTVGKTRYEVVLEGTRDASPRAATEWKEYEFRGKPGDPRRLPRQFAPYHLRLDWQMWFAALAPFAAVRWLRPLLGRLLQGEPATVKLLRVNPFPQQPPRYVRARLYRYRFTTWAERRETGAWWHRVPIEELVPPISAASGPVPLRD